MKILNVPAQGPKTAVLQAPSWEIWGEAKAERPEPFEVTTQRSVRLCVELWHSENLNLLRDAVESLSVGGGPMLHAHAHK